MNKCFKPKLGASMDKFMDGVAQGMGWGMAMGLMLFAVHALPLLLR